MRNFAKRDKTGFLELITRRSLVQVLPPQPSRRGLRIVRDGIFLPSLIHPARRRDYFSARQPRQSFPPRAVERQEITLLHTAPPQGYALRDPYRLKATVLEHFSTHFSLPKSVLPHFYRTISKSKASMFCIDAIFIVQSLIKNHIRNNIARPYVGFFDDVNVYIRDGTGFELPNHFDVFTAVD